MQLLPGSFGMLTLSLLPLENHVVKGSCPMKRLHVVGAVSPGIMKKPSDDSGPSILSYPTTPAEAPHIIRQRQISPAVPSLNS